MIESYIERWDLAKDRYRVAILRDGTTLEWCETTSDGCTTGRGATLKDATMPRDVLGLIATFIGEGYELGGHEVYDPGQLLGYLTGLEAPDIAETTARCDAWKGRAQALKAEAEQLRRQLEAAEAQPCDHNSDAFEALERLHGRIHRDFNFDAGECAPPTEDEIALRMMDDLVAFADEVYLPLADATTRPAQTPTVRITQESIDLIRNTAAVWEDNAAGVGCSIPHPPEWYRARIADFEQLLALVAPAEPGPLESVVTEAVADIANDDPADPEATILHPHRGAGPT